ncbi:hypothetical protein SULAR_08417 [Sulfurovum sp. AR]|nr:hypothetical protein SULAR_08417 [Sulfurovum sp. AR]
MRQQLKKEYEKEMKKLVSFMILNHSQMHLKPFLPMSLRIPIQQQRKRFMDTVQHGTKLIDQQSIWLKRL